MALSIGCFPKKDSVSPSAQQEPRACALANYLVEKGTKIDDLFCQGYTNETQEIHYIFVCYMTPNAPDPGKDTLSISFDTNPTVFFDTKADDTLDKFSLEGETTASQEIPWRNPT